MFPYCPIPSTTLVHVLQAHERQQGLRKGSDIMCLWSQQSLAAGLSTGEMRHSVELDPSAQGCTDQRSPCGTQDLPLTTFHCPQASSHGRQVRLCTPARLLHASGHTLMLTWTCMLMLLLCFFHLVTMLWLTRSTMIYSDENSSHHCVANSFMTLHH